jgi:hypothetical protein
MASMTLNPRAEFKLGVAVFSPTKPGLSSSRLEPSQPWWFSKIHVHAHQSMSFRAMLMLAIESFLCMANVSDQTHADSQAVMYVGC